MRATSPSRSRTPAAPPLRTPPVPKATMQFVFSSEQAPQEPLPRSTGGSSDAVDATQDEAGLLGAARGVLERTSLREYLAARPHRAIAALDVRMNVREAVEVLAGNNVLSAPLFDIQKKRFLTLLGVADLLRAFLQALPSLCGPEAADEDVVPTAEALANAGERFSLTALERIVPPEAERDGENLALDTTAEATLLDVAASVFLRPARHAHHASRAVAHRAVVFSYAPDATLTDFGYRPALAMDIRAVISQSDLIRYLQAHSAELGALRGASVAQLRLGSAPVAVVPADVSALTAFRALLRGGLSALGVVAPGVWGGALVGNISCTDLRGLGPHQYGRLTLPVGRFLAENSAQSLLCVAVPQSAKLGAVLDRLVYARVHRVYVVDDDGRPVRMITCTDILRLLTPPAEHSVAESEPISRQLAQATASAAAAAAADAEARRAGAATTAGAPMPPSREELERAAAELAREVGDIMHGTSTPEGPPAEMMR